MIEESDKEVTAKYVGVHLQKEGFGTHRKKAAKKMVAANGRLENLTMER